ncbi:MAG: hypothetical protein Q6365_020105, partial [Candidatus Sigynarchaeota archaeon]
MLYALVRHSSKPDVQSNEWRDETAERGNFVSHDAHQESNQFLGSIDLIRTVLTYYSDEFKRFFQDIKTYETTS